MKIFKIWYKVKLLIPGFMRDMLIDMIYGVRSMKYRGNSVFCPVCQGSFSGFVDSSVGSCPACGAGARHRFFFLYLQSRTNFFSERLKVLHFAPEHCFFRRFRKIANIDYLSADLNSPRAMKKVDMTAIPFADESFDVILSSHVLEHVPDDRKAMRELCRVQKKGGWSIHLVPIDYSREKTYEDASVNSDELRQRIYGHHDHKRIYGKDYGKRLQDAGFNVHVIDFCAELSGEERKEYGLRESGKIYLCEKR